MRSVEKALERLRRIFRTLRDYLMSQRFDVLSYFADLRQDVIRISLEVKRNDFELLFNVANIVGHRLMLACRVNK